MALSRGVFVSIEGGEGAGKTLQARALVAHLEERGFNALYVREPGGTPVGERVRDVLLFTQDLQVRPEAEALLFSAARAQLAREVIRPALESGTHVVADRYADSTIAYQGYGAGIDVAALYALSRFAVGETVPVVTFLLDIATSVAASRMRERSEQWDRIEARDAGFHERVRRGYLELARQDPERWVILDGSLPAQELSRVIARRVTQEIRHHSNTIPTRP